MKDLRIHWDASGLRLVRVPPWWARPLCMRRFWLRHSA